MVAVLKKRKKDSALAKFAETITTQYGKAEKILLDTGPQATKYRVIANLQRKICPACKTIHYSSLSRDTCLGCTAILNEERRLGRKMNPKERAQFLKKIDL